jgi:hypothetical protein
MMAALATLCSGVSWASQSRNPSMSALWLRRPSYSKISRDRGQMWDPYCLCDLPLPRTHNWM